MLHPTALAALISLPLLSSVGCGSQAEQKPSSELPAPTTAGPGKGDPNNPDPQQPQPNNPDANKDPSASLFEKRASQLERDIQPEISDELRQSFAKGNLDLSLEMLRALDPSAASNKVVSALSLQSAFGMVHGMARGQTQQEISQALHFPADPQQAQSTLNATDLALVSRNLPKSDTWDPLVFTTANRVFVSKDSQPGKAYLDLLATNYGTGVFAADFSTKSGEILKEINRWVSERTYKRIPEVVTAADIGPNTTWVLVNAIYFKAPWSFETEQVRKRSFTFKDGQKKEVDFVTAPEVSTRYGQVDGGTWIRLPLRGGELAMTMILPDEGKFDELRNKLSGETLNRWFSQAKQGAVALHFPKFKVDSGIMDLVPMLRGNGMELPFSAADFGAFGENGEGLRPITFVKQRVFVAADENGVEAAAATAVGSKESAAEIDLELEINRPFFFLVHDRETGVALFAGQILDPLV